MELEEVVVELVHMMFRKVENRKACEDGFVETEGRSVAFDSDEIFRKDAEGFECGLRREIFELASRGDESDGAPVSFVLHRLAKGRVVDELEEVL